MNRRMFLGTLAGALVPGALRMLHARPAEGKSEDMAAVVNGNNEFAFDLYGQIRGQSGNLFCSPYSIANALAMTHAGARGETADQMTRALRLGRTGPALHKAYAELIGYLHGKAKQHKYELTVANALWGQQGFSFKDDFHRTTKDGYDAGLRQVDFIKAHEEARLTINRWVEEQTRDKIKDLLKPGSVDPMTRLVLTNAIYFKAAWVDEFAEQLTKDEDFRLTADKKKTVKMMHRTNDLRYSTDDMCQVVELPYDMHEMKMVILLPKKVDGLAELEKNLTYAKLTKYGNDAKIHQVTLSLPKFKMTTEFNLSEALMGLGMKRAFVPGQADFTGISESEPLHISAVVHKAYVDVHEKGTEAAAATAVLVGATSIPEERPKAVVRVDHPFLFLIRDQATGSILFMGRVVEA